MDNGKVLVLPQSLTQYAKDGPIFTPQCVCRYKEELVSCKASYHDVDGTHAIWQSHQSTID